MGVIATVTSDNVGKKDMKGEMGTWEEISSLLPFHWFLTKKKHTLILRLTHSTVKSTPEKTPPEINPPLLYDYNVWFLCSSQNKKYLHSFPC